MKAYRTRSEAYRKKKGASTTVRRMTNANKTSAGNKAMTRVHGRWKYRASANRPSPCKASRSRFSENRRSSGGQKVNAARFALKSRGKESTEALKFEGTEKCYKSSIW